MVFLKSSAKLDFWREEKKEEDEKLVYKGISLTGKYVIVRSNPALEWIYKRFILGKYE